MKTSVDFVEEKDKKNFNKLATHPLQSWEWGEFRKSQGYKLIRLGKKENGRLKEVFQVSFHQIPLTNFSVGYLPKSPFPSLEVSEKLKQIGKQQKAIFIKLEPNVETTLPPNTYHLSPFLIKGKPLFTKYTSIIDLSRSEEEIFKSFKSKTRYNIRLAEKHGVKVREDNSNKAFEKYLKLLFETCLRQGFYAHNKDYHRQQWQILQPAGISRLLTATYKGKILSVFLLFVFNHTLYYPYGASTREHKELMAPTLLMWEAIKLGKKIGCTKFDLWGDTEPNPPPNHRYFGFHRFKQGFSPRLVEFVGSYDLVINSVLYRVYKIIDKVRWGILHLKSKLTY